MSIAAQLAYIQDQIAHHATASHVTLVGVSKYVPLEDVIAAYEAGVRHFGENRVQDALAKMDALPSDMAAQCQWHLIGSLQTNKVKKTPGRFTLIHSVDSLRLGEAIARANNEAGLRQAVLLQVNLSADPSRHGFMPDALASALQKLNALEGIVVRGLMGMAPPEASLAGDSEDLRRIFGDLRQLRDSLQDKLEIDLPELSMGMSHDFVPALSSGATIIRIGNFLFKNQHLTYNNNH